MERGVRGSEDGRKGAREGDKEQAGCRPIQLRVIARIFSNTSVLDVSPDLLIL